MPLAFLSFYSKQLKENFHNCTEILDKKLYELSTKEGKNFSYEEDKLKGKIVIINLSGRGDKDMIQAKSLLKFDE